MASTRSPRLSALADAGALYALLDRSDSWHERVRRWWEQPLGEIVLPATILPQITSLLGRGVGSHAEEAFVRALAAGEFAVEPLEMDDLARAAELMGTYAGLPLGFVDASIVALAERLEVTSLLTTERRRFSVVRPKHVERLKLVPEPLGG